MRGGGGNWYYRTVGLGGEDDGIMVAHSLSSVWIPGGYNMAWYNCDFICLPGIGVC